MADGRDVAVWDNHAQECRDQGRVPFKFNGDEWLRLKVLGLLESEGITFVMDVGCGPGFWVDLFEGIPRYVGVDQSQEMLKLAREHTPPPPAGAAEGACFIYGQARELTTIPYGPLPDFDLIFTSSVLQHNRHEPDKREIVEQIGKMLRPGGYFLCTENTFRADNCPQSVGNPDYTDNYSFTPEGWEKFMLALGFKLLEFNGQSEYFFQKV